MKKHILPNEPLVLFLREKNGSESDEVVTAAIAICRDDITVSEYDSCNGLALITPAFSGTPGTYHYQYEDRDHKSHSLDVTRIERMDGEQITVTEFIED